MEQYEYGAILGVTGGVMALPFLIAAKNYKGAMWALLSSMWAGFVLAIAKGML